MNGLTITRRLLSLLKNIPVIGVIAGLWWDLLFGDGLLHYGCPNSSRTAKLQTKKKVIK